MDHVISKPQAEKLILTILPHEGDLAAETRVRTFLDLAITIAKREGLIGKHLPNSNNTYAQSTKNKED